MVRLHQVSYSFQAHKETGRGVAANRLAGIAGFAPTTFHAIGARVAAASSRAAASSSSVTNVPGPQSPLYAAGARMVATYPVPPLLPGHALAIGVTSYDGARLLRHHRRPGPAARRRPARAPACARRSTSCSTPPPGAGPGRRAAAARRGAGREGARGRRRGAATERDGPDECARLRPADLHACWPGWSPRAASTARCARTPSPTPCARRGPSGDEEALGVRRADGRRGRPPPGCAGAGTRRAATWSPPTCPASCRCRARTPRWSTSPPTSRGGTSPRPTSTPPTDRPAGRRRRGPRLVRHPGDRAPAGEARVDASRPAIGTRGRLASLTHREHGRDHLPAGSHQRAEPDLRAGQPRTGGPGHGDRRARGHAARPARPTSAASRSTGGGAEIEVVQPHDHQHVLGAMQNSTQADAKAAVAGGDRRGARVARDVLRRPVRDHAQGRRPARRPVAPADQRRHDARPVQDRLPGRDRQRLRADRLLALQRPLRQADPHRPADREQPRASGTAPTTARSRASSTRSRRSTSPRSPATCRPRRR